jgi:hypothetical protein
MQFELGHHRVLAAANLLERLDLKPPGRFVDELRDPLDRDHVPAEGLQVLGGRSIVLLRCTTPLRQQKRGLTSTWPCCGPWLAEVCSGDC